MKRARYTRRRQWRQGAARAGVQFLPPGTAMTLTTYRSPAARALHAALDFAQRLRRSGG